MKQERRIAEINKFYSSYPAMESKWTRMARQKGFHGQNLAEFEEWKEKTSKHIWSLLGMDQMESCSLSAVIQERILLPDGIIREKVLIQTEPQVWMPMYILIPSNPKKEKQTCFIAPCGHLGAGKYSVAGCQEFEGVKERIDLYQYDYGMQLAKRGFVAICPDARGFGERREGNVDPSDEKSFFECSCYQISHMAEAMGETLMGMLVWDLIRLVDYLEERGEWNLDDLGCLGFSGGGMQTLWFSALDKRVKQCVISGYFYGYHDSLFLLSGNCNCNYVPHFFKYYDIGDLGSLLAPRPVTIQSCSEDHLNGPRGLKNVEEQLEILKKAYGFYHVEKYIVWDVCNGPHSFHRENMTAFLTEMGNQCGLI